MTTITRRDVESGWQRKESRLSDTTARKEFGLTQEEIVQEPGSSSTGATRSTATSSCGLSGAEAEALVEKKHGVGYLENQRAKAELALVTRELKRVKTEVAALDARRTELLPYCPKAHPAAILARRVAREQPHPGERARSAPSPTRRCSRDVRRGGATTLGPGSAPRPLAEHVARRPAIARGGVPAASRTLDQGRARGRSR